MPADNLPPRDTSNNLAEKERQEREKLILRLWLKGLPNDDAIAYRGDSLESLHYGCETGLLPGTVSNEYASDPHLPQPGDIYTYPAWNKFTKELKDLLQLTPKQEQKLQDETEEKTLQTGCYSSAKDNAQTTHLLVKLNLPPGDEDAREAAHFLCAYYNHHDSEWTEYYDYLRPHADSDEELQSFIDDARKRQGVIIGISAAAFAHFKISTGDEISDIRIQTLIGLPIEYIAGIRAEGPSELAYFQELQKKYPDVTAN